MPAALPLYATLPFVAMLLAIAILPLAAPHWWEPNRNKLIVSAGLGLPVLVLYFGRQPTALVHMGGDYVSFVVLLGGLYAIAGGILLRGDLEATPAVNGTFLGAGALLASLIGTTGATMLLIRPLLQTNRERRHATHTVVFFIFLVGNVGGMLTPLGDPPLFLGYLAGVPFTWPLRLWPPWLTMVAGLLGVYLAWDWLLHRREAPAALRRDRARIEPLRVDGGLNALGLLGVVAAVALLSAPGREIAIVALAALSLWRTPATIRRANQFTAGPMVEVAVLFLGIFLTMIPALELLRAARRRDGRPDPRAVLLGHRRALLVPRQRAHLPRLPRPRPGPGPARGGGGSAARHPGRDQRGRGGDGGEHLHRQRAELHGEGDRGGARESACRPSSATWSTAERCCCRSSPWSRGCSSSPTPESSEGRAVWRDASRSAASCRRSSWGPCPRAWPPPSACPRGS